MEAHATAESSDKPSSDSSTVTSGIATSSDSNTQKALDIILGQDEGSDSTVSCQDQLDLYFAEKSVARDVQPLKWWKENNARFPRLADVARVLLGIPATSVPAERIFSTAGLTVTKLHSRLKPESVDALIFLHDNLFFLPEFTEFYQTVSD